jgi:hypothetical protein
VHAVINNKLPTPIRPTEPLEVIRRDCGELCNTSRDASPGPCFNHVTAECKLRYALGNIQVPLLLEEKPTQTTIIIMKI